MAYIDPWSGYNEGTKTLASVADSLVAYRRQQELDAMAKQDWELKHAAAQQAWDDDQNRRALERELAVGKQETYQRPTGAFTSDQSTAGLATALKQLQQGKSAADLESGLGLKLTSAGKSAPEAQAMQTLRGVVDRPSTPVMETATRTVPYNTQELAQKRSALLQSQGNYKGAAEAAGQTYDITEQYPKHIQDMNTMALKAYQNYLGMTNGDGKAALDLLIRDLEDQRFEPEIIEAYKKVTPGPGGALTAKIPGGALVMTLDNGKWKTDLRDDKAPKEHEVMGNFISGKLGRESVEEYPQFKGPDAAARAAEFNRLEGTVSGVDAKRKLAVSLGASGFKKHNENTPQSVSISLQRERPEDVVASGPDAGARLYKTAGGGPSFYYREGKDGKPEKVTYYGAQAPKAQALNVEGSTSVADARVKIASIKASGAALTQDVKVFDTMDGFIGNMDKQIARVKQLAQYNPTTSTGLRILNLPINQAKKVIAGDSKLAAYQAYIASIESEAGKLAAGGSGSVRELSQGAQKKWDKLVDKNLSINDMLAVLEEIRHEGGLKLESQANVINSRTKAIGGGKEKPIAPAGTRVPKKGGGYYTSDGKGGWS